MLQKCPLRPTREGLQTKRASQACSTRAYSCVVTNAAHAHVPKPRDHAHMESTSRRSALAMLSLTVCALSPQLVQAAEVGAQATMEIGSKAPANSVYFGNGCFWGRQYDFANTELALGRKPEEMTAVVGYAGGTRAGPGEKVCYYYSDPRTVYEKLGHAEVVQLNLSSSSDAAVQEFRTFADVYFKQFQKTYKGMMRLDPQDAGPGYRNVIGLPGGVKSPLFTVLQQANVNGMELREGKGNTFMNGKPTEDDLLNVVWVVDSNERPFYRAERYHQFHNGIGAAFPTEYTQGLKNLLARLGRIDPTGCPELPF